jgi:hypothetical protein
MLFPCAFSPWSPGIGDAHVMGWVTVAVYVAASAACVSAARLVGADPDASRRERLFWWVSAGMLLLLAVNKQLDLQSLLTSIARCMAVEQGWYDMRRDVQLWFVETVAVLGAVALAAAALYFRKTFRRTGLAVLGLAFVATFVVVRAASFHHVDLLIDREVFGLRLNWILELSGPCLILWAAVRSGGIPRT